MARLSGWRVRTLLERDRRINTIAGSTGRAQAEFLRRRGIWNYQSSRHRTQNHAGGAKDVRSS